MCGGKKLRRLPGDPRVMRARTRSFVTLLRPLDRVPSTSSVSRATLSMDQGSSYRLVIRGFAFYRFPLPSFMVPPFNRARLSYHTETLTLPASLSPSFSLYRPSFIVATPRIVLRLALS